MRLNEYWTKQKKRITEPETQVIEIIHTKVYSELKKFFLKKRE